MPAEAGSIDLGERRPQSQPAALAAGCAGARRATRHALDQRTRRRREVYPIEERVEAALQVGTLRAAQAPRAGRLAVQAAR